jgi:hypothetical protein
LLLPDRQMIKLSGLFKLWPSIPVWALMDVTADLLIRSNRYRGMAARITDEETRMALLDLAAKYEALAREMQADDRRKAP